MLPDGVGVTLEVAVTPEVQMVVDSPPCENDLYALAGADIECRFKYPGRSLDSLVQGMRSSRSVTRAFARCDQTPMAMVWQLGLQTSRRALE